jgi:uncharacterized membrane protein YcaP (DUF421 family)
MGNRQMSQVSMFDYISSIALGSIAGELAVQSTASIIKPLVSMAIFALLAILISYITNKSIMLRRLFEGQPILLFQNGQIFEKNLLKAKLDMDEFLSLCRISGYFDLEEVYAVYLETNGTISVLPAANKRPATPEDHNLNPTQNLPMANVIIDGKIMKDNLKSTGKNVQWVEKQLQAKKIPDISEVILANYDSTKDKLNIYTKFHRKMLRDIYE